MLVPRIKDLLDDFLTTIVPHESAHLKLDMASIRLMLASWDTELIDAVLSAAHRSGMSVEDISFTTGYGEKFVQSRLRLIDAEDVLVLDVPVPGPDSRKSMVEKQKRRRNKLGLTKASLEHILNKEARGIWLLDPIVGNRKQSRNTRAVRNPNATSTPSGIEWALPSKRVSHRRPASGRVPPVPGSP